MSRDSNVKTPSFLLYALNDYDLSKFYMTYDAYFYIPC